MCFHCKHEHVPSLCYSTAESCNSLFGQAYQQSTWLMWNTSQVLRLIAITFYFFLIYHQWYLVPSTTHKFKTYRRLPYRDLLVWLWKHEEWWNKLNNEIIKLILFKHFNFSDADMSSSNCLFCPITSSKPKDLHSSQLTNQSCFSIKASFLAKL